MVISFSCSSLYTLFYFSLHAPPPIPVLPQSITILFSLSRVTPSLPQSLTPCITFVNVWIVACLQKSVSQAVLKSPFKTFKIKDVRELLILFPLSPKCWDYKCVPLHLFSRALYMLSKCSINWITFICKEKSMKWNTWIHFRRSSYSNYIEEQLRHNEWYRNNFQVMSDIIQQPQVTTIKL